jgi:hypothetical protein
VNVERFDWDVHGDMLANWYRARGVAEDAGDRALYPAVGFVVDRCVCAWFYRTDGGIAFADQFATAPDASHERRTAASEQLARTLADYARSEGFRAVASVTNVRRAVDACVTAGWTLVGDGYSYVIALG